MRPYYDGQRSQNYDGQRPDTGKGIPSIWDRGGREGSRGESWATQRDRLAGGKTEPWQEQRRGGDRPHDRAAPDATWA